MDIIIVGCGKVGSTIAEHLNEEGHSIVVVDTKADKLEILSNKLDIMTIEGNGATSSVLIEAGVDTADLLIAVTNRDEVNLYCCLIAKKSGVKNAIARVRNPEYSEDIHLIKDDLGLSLSINPELTAASEMSRLIRYPAAIEINRFAKGGAELYKLRLPSFSKLNGKAVKDICGIGKSDYQICAVEREYEVFIPSGDFVLNNLDKIYILSKPKDAMRMFKSFDVPVETGRTAILVGGGRIAVYLAKQLISSNISVKIIEVDPVKCEEISDILPNATILCGDGLDKEFLLEEGLATVDAFASLTGLDEENIILSLYAASVSKAKIMTKVNKLTFDNIIDKMEIGSVIRPKYLTSEYIIQYVRAIQNSLGSNVESLYKIVGGKAEALEFVVREDSKVTGKELGKLTLKENLLIASINRNGKIIVPSGNDTIEIGDSVIVVTTHKKLRDLTDILK